MSLSNFKWYASGGTFPIYLTYLLMVDFIKSNLEKLIGTHTKSSDSYIDSPWHMNCFGTSLIYGKVIRYKLFPLQQLMIFKCIYVVNYMAKDRSQWSFIECYMILLCKYYLLCFSWVEISIVQIWCQTLFFLFLGKV